MHLQQTKKGSRGTGGPQYYFHDLSDSVKTYLRKKGSVKVALVTPYGATKSDYTAISTDRKVDRKTQNLVPGNVGHDRIQQGRASESIGESIRNWYNPENSDFDRIDIDVEIIDDIFYITPLSYKFSYSKKEHEIARRQNPLTFTRDYISPFWREQLDSLDKDIVLWSLAEICRVVRDHKEKVPHIQETDILRAAGPLKHLGMALGAYVGKGYDCCSTAFNFLDYPTYTVPVEIKRHSRKFSYQEKRYGKEELSRAVILCAVHDKKNVPRNIDVVELDALCNHLQNI
jgi:hypothetical protein